MSYEERIEKAANLIANSSYMVGFTGAGISTESGIPDFRGPNGLWTRRDKGLPPPKTKKPWNEVEPNIGHKILVEFQNMGIMKFLISQNIDGLHLKSGINLELLAEFHGNMTLMRCLECNKRHKKEGLWDSKVWGSGMRKEPVRKGQPVCPNCGGRIINDVVNFGDPIPMDAITNSIKHARKSDVFLVVGSTLTVTPAANMPLYAIDNGSKLIIINNQETPFDDLCVVRFYEDAGETLISILKKVKEMKR